MKYRAFISYSHKQERWAGWIHRKLETYKVPKAIVGSDGRDGPVPERLGTVFRDRDELPTSADLGSALTEALDQSMYLVVICSPDAARSRWVNEEILRFKRAGRENRILPFIVDGEPNATDRGAPEREAFPEALRFAIGEDGELTTTRVEPIAADARPGADGKHNAVLKLIAGLLGTNFDALKQRERRRAQARRRKLTTIGASIALVIGVLGVIAYAQSGRASRAIARTGELESVARGLKDQWVSSGVEITPMVDAILLGDIAALESLDPSAEEINAFWGPESLNALMVACAVGNGKVAQWLIDHGADPNRYNDQGYAPIHVAAGRGRPGTAEVLKNAGVDLNMPWKHRGGIGWRPIDIAADDESLDFLNEILDLGVPIETESPDGAYDSPLFLAAYFGQTEAIKLLLERGARVDLKDDLDRTPYKCAVQNGHTAAAELLAKASGVDDSTLLDEQLYGMVIMVATGQEDLSEIRRLLDQGADPNYVGEYDLTTYALAISMAASSVATPTTRPNALELVRLLKAAGGRADVNRPMGQSVFDRFEHTPDPELEAIISD